MRKDDINDLDTAKACRIFGPYADHIQLQPVLQGTPVGEAPDLSSTEPDKCTLRQFQASSTAVDCNMSLQPCMQPATPLLQVLLLLHVVLLLLHVALWLLHILFAIAARAVVAV